MLKDFVAIIFILSVFNVFVGVSYGNEDNNPPAQNQLHSANNGNRFLSTSFSVIADASESLVTKIEGDTLTVVDGSTTLFGMSITSQTADLSTLKLAKLPVSDAPKIPAWITPLTNFFVVRGSFKSNLELRFPIQSLPANVSLSEVDLYAYTEAEGIVEKFWSPVSIEINYEGTLDTPVIVIHLGGLEGEAFLGYSTPQNE